MDELMSVLEIRCDHGDTNLVITDDAENLPAILALMLGDSGEWKDFPGDIVTIEVKQMKKSDFDALEVSDE